MDPVGPRGRAAVSSYLYTGWGRLVYPRPALQGVGTVATTTVATRSTLRVAFDQFFLSVTFDAQIMPAMWKNSASTVFWVSVRLKRVERCAELIDRCLV